MSFQWNYGDIIEAMETITSSDHPALVQGERTITWGQMQRRTNNLANNLIASGVEVGDKIAFYMRNCPEYSEGINAGFKARLTHVNVNYRYIDRELLYLLDNSDAKVVIYQSEFQRQVDQIRDQLPKVKHWLAVNNDGQSNYEEMAESGDGRSTNLTRSPKDLLFLYTGGTTGMPKGVLWRQEESFYSALTAKSPPDLEFLQQRARSRGEVRALPAPPFMHGAAHWSAFNYWHLGGTVLVQSNVERLDPDDIWSVSYTHLTLPTNREV